MSRAPKPNDDLDCYIEERDAREPGFAALVANPGNKRAAAHEVGAQTRDRYNSDTDC